MRRLLLALAIVSFLTVNVNGQNKIHFMMVSIHTGSNARQPELIVTKEDGKQQITKAVKNSWMWKATSFNYTRNGGIEESEDSLFQILKPYFDDGWQLSASTIIRNGNFDDYIARYYFTKKED
jgi:hypothetical protein